MQVEKINEFIGARIVRFRSKVLAQLKTKLDSNLSPNDLEFISKRINDIETNYTKFLSEFNNTDSKTGERSFVYRSILSYLKKNYGIHIEDTSSIIELEDFDSEGNHIAIETNAATFNDRDGLKIDKKKSVSQDIKFLISQSIIKSNNNNLAINLDVHSKY